MKRWLLRICILLLLGAIVNVAVAWGCAYRYPTIAPMLHQERWDAETLDEWSSVALREWPAPAAIRRHNYGHDGEPPGSAMVAYDNDPLTFTTEEFVLPGRTMTISWEDYGWPCLSLRAMQWTDNPPDHLYPLKIVKRTYMEVARGHDPWQPLRRIPLRPIWPGFAINTVFYSGVLWLLFAAPFALRRRRRIKRGLCPKCAYDLRGSNDASACPECGAAMKPRLVRSSRAEQRL